MDPDVPRLLRRLVWATVALYLVLAGAGFYVVVDAGNRREEIAEVAITTNEALCALRLGHVRRAQDQRDFLEENPDGIPGIDPDVIRESIQREEDIIGDLAVVTCPSELEP